MAASRPAARAALTFFEFLLGPSNAAITSDLLLGILDPADELVAGQRRDVVPRIERHGVPEESVAQICGELVHHTTGHSPTAHNTKIAGLPRRCDETSGGCDRMIRPLLAGHLIDDYNRTQSPE